MTPIRGRRIVRKRGKNFPLPAGAFYVGKPTHRANPFAGRQWGHAKSVMLHRRWLAHNLGALTLEELGFCPAEIDSLQRLRIRVLNNIDELIGADLACCCPASISVTLAIFRSSGGRAALAADFFRASSPSSDP